MKVKLVGITQPLVERKSTEEENSKKILGTFFGDTQKLSPEEFIIYIARVSNPSNQLNPEIEKLIKYLIENKHWSPFEHVSFTVEIETSLAIATQILRHRSFTFQQIINDQFYSFIKFYEREIQLFKNE